MRLYVSYKETHTVYDLGVRYQWLIGRDPSCHIVLNGVDVSRCHATLSVFGNKVLIMDGCFNVADSDTDVKPSRNGTFIGDLKLDQEKILNVGDTVYIGAFILKLEIDEVEDNDETLH